MQASLSIAEQRPLVRVLIVENSSFQREGVQSLTQPYRDLDVVGIARDTNDVLQMAARTSPDVIVINMYDDTDVTRVLHDLRQRLRGARFLVLLNSTDRGISRGLRAAGADELLFGFVRPPIVIEAIRRLAQDAREVKLAMI